MTEQAALDALRTLLRASHLARADDLPALADAAGARLGARRAAIYVVDYDQVVLVPLQLGIAGGEDPVPPLLIDGTLAGRAFTDVVQHVSAAEGSVTLWTPVVDGTDRLGVLQLEFANGTEVDDELRTGGLDVAALLAEMVTTRGFYGDAVERARRRAGMTVPAEMQWTMLPPLTFVSPRVAIAGVLAPTAEVAGDSFDYAVNDSTAHVAIMDAMGHGMEATLLAAVAVSTLRNARRLGADLAQTVRSMDAEIAAHFGRGKFVTAIIGELDLVTGWWRWMTCGHPPALVVRRGQVVKELSDVVSPPLGLHRMARVEPRIGHERLQPGDRLVLYSDGVVEARDHNGNFFGVDRLVDFVGRHAAADRPVAETLRRLNHAVLEYQAGTLQDDATTVLVEWLSNQPEASTPVDVPEILDV